MLKSLTFLSSRVVVARIRELQEAAADAEIIGIWGIQCKKGRRLQLTGYSPSQSEPSTQPAIIIPFGNLKATIEECYV